MKTHEHARFTGLYPERNGQTHALFWWPRINNVTGAEILDDWLLPRPTLEDRLATLQCCGFPREQTEKAIRNWPI